MSTLCQLMGSLVTIVNKKEGGTAGCEPAALSQICSLRSTHTLPHTLCTAAHCRTQCTLMHTTCTTHNTHKSLPQQPTGSSTQAMHIPTNPTDGKSQCTWTDQSDWRVLRDDRIFGGLQALQWIGTVGVGAATHTNGQLTKRGDLHQRGDNQSRFPRAPSPVAPNP